jgi:glycosyltransferase involved in cell wall biosynthesis
MRITIVAPIKSRFGLASATTTGLGGIETACIELSRALAARGHEMILVSQTDEPAREPEIANVGFANLATIEGDVLIACNDARLLENALHGQRVLWMHNPLALEKAARRRQIGPMWRWRPRAVFGSRDAERACSRIYPFASRQVVPLGVTREFLSAEVGQPRELRFIWASQPQRGLPQAVAAWRAHFAAMPPGASLDIFGSTTTDAGISPTDATAAGINFHPRATKADLARVFERSLALICPGAADETFCLAAAEAQCVGLPVLTLGIGSLAERVSHGINGLVTRDFGELGVACARLASDPELAELLRRGALATRGLLTWERTAKLWEDLLTMIGDAKSTN